MPQNNKMGGSEIITGHLSRVTGIAGFLRFGGEHHRCIRAFEDLPSFLIRALTSYRIYLCGSVAAWLLRLPAKHKKNSRKQPLILAVQILSILLLVSNLSVASAEQLHESVAETIINPAIKISIKNNLISMSADRVDLRDVFTALSKLSNVPITVVDLDSKIEVSISFRKKTLIEALKLLQKKLPAGGLAIVNAENQASSEQKINHVYVLVKEGGTSAVASSQQGDKATMPGRNSIYVSPESAKDVLWLRNHNALLSVQNEYRDFIEAISSNDPAKDPRVPEFKRWGRILYEDAVLAELLSEDTAEEKRQKLSQIIGQLHDELDIDLLGESIPSTSKYYPNTLKRLLKQTQEIIQREITQRQAVSLANAYIDQVKRRKDYSDSLYEAEMKKFFRDDKPGVSDKVSFMEPYLQRRDLDLLRYGYSYFEELPRFKKLNQEEQRLVEAFKQKVIQEEK